MSKAIQAVNGLLAEWIAARVLVAEIERKEYPNITDDYGRVWVWKSKTLYVHCGSAVPGDMIGEFGLPTQRALDNPNYNLCSICLDGRERNIRPCNPEWNCSHLYCQSALEIAPTQSV